MSASVSAGDGDDSSISDINVTPLVDVVLVLLIVFMITMPTIVKSDLLNERQLSVVLPEAGAAKPLISTPKELFVNIDADGVWSVRQVTQTPTTLLSVLQQEQANNPGRAAVVIRADKFCRWQFIVPVMDLCNQAGITDYRVSTVE